MSEYKKLASIVERWGEYCVQVGESANEEGFALFLLNNRPIQPKLVSIEELKMAVEKSQIPIEAHISDSVKKIFRFIQMYSKKALEPWEMNFEDFNYLSTLVGMGHPTKSELINLNLSEFTSGIDTIKRLLKAGLVAEVPDCEDKRSKRIVITQAGIDMFWQIIPAMRSVSDKIFQNTSEDEKYDLLARLLPLLKSHLTGYYQDKHIDNEKLRTRIESENWEIKAFFGDKRTD